ncbi:MAG: radical SAM protein [Planctomycetes bacterium SM23_25]|nr:MAG: radical SAM protein [Planctomycetes bacterium SM23_25]
MTARSFRHVFGPVPSRRLGRSLGVDLVPLKTCTYDCIYCQLGRTTNKTVERREYVPLEEVLTELRLRLEAGPTPDYVTLSGSGEPTLYGRLDELIGGIKNRTDVPVAVLTNGSLLWDPDVRESLMDADLVLPSLDAADPLLFRYVNRPHRAITFERMVAGLVALREVFSKPIWLEVFLLGGVTAIEVEVEKLARLADRIKPDRVQINTVARPAAEDFACAVPHKQMEQYAKAFGDRAEVIGAFHGGDRRGEWTATDDAVLDLVRRRPCTLRDVADALCLHPEEVVKQIDRLLGSSLICATKRDGSVYYVPVASRRGGFHR